MSPTSALGRPARPGPVQLAVPRCPGTTAVWRCFLNAVGPGPDSVSGRKTACERGRRGQTASRDDGGIDVAAFQGRVLRVPEGAQDISLFHEQRPTPARPAPVTQPATDARTATSAATPARFGTPREVRPLDPQRVEGGEHVNGVRPGALRSRCRTPRTRAGRRAPRRGWPRAPARSGPASGGRRCQRTGAGAVVLPARPRVWASIPAEFCKVPLHGDGLSDRQDQPEVRVRRRADQGQRPAVPLGDRAGDREPEAGAAVGTRRVSRGGNTRRPLPAARQALLRRRREVDPDDVRIARCPQLFRKFTWAIASRPCCGASRRSSPGSPVLRLAPPRCRRWAHFSGVPSRPPPVPRPRGPGAGGSAAAHRM